VPPPMGSHGSWPTSGPWRCSTTSASWRSTTGASWRQMATAGASWAHLQRLQSLQAQPIRWWCTRSQGWGSLRHSFDGAVDRLSEEAISQASSRGEPSGCTALVAVWCRPGSSPEKRVQGRTRELLLGPGL